VHLRVRMLSLSESVGHGKYHGYTILSVANYLSYLPFAFACLEEEGMGGNLAFTFFFIPEVGMYLWKGGSSHSHQNISPYRAGDGGRGRGRVIGVRKARCRVY